MQKVKPKELKQIIEKVAINGKLPIMIWGAPGIGKSEIINGVAKEMEMKALDLRLNYYEEADLLGIPIRTEKGMEFIKYSAFPKSGNGLFFLDELTHAKTSIQGLAFQMINDKRIESYEIPDGWQHFVAASNRASDRTISNPMPSGLANRFTGGHYELVPDFEEWRPWAIQHKIDNRIISFLDYMEANDKAEWLFRMEKGETFLSPRVWATGVNYSMTSLPDKLRDTTIKGIIGEENGIQFIAYLNKLQDMPDIPKIIGGDHTWLNQPHDASMYSLLTNGVAQYTVEHKAVLEKAMEIILKLPEEFGVQALRVLMQVIDRNVVASSKVLQKSIGKYQDLLKDF